MTEMHINDTYHTHCFFLFLSLFSFFISFLFYCHTVSPKQWFTINPSFIEYSVLKELSVCLVKEGDWTLS